MTSITTWVRLEPQCRSADMNSGLQARIYDPLWLLARQWQVGEFQGQDNGSPAAARWRGEATPLTHFFPGPLTDGGHVEGKPFDGAATPLETVVERESARPAAGGIDRLGIDRLRFAADAGQQFLRLLGQQPISRSYRDAVLAAFPFVPLSEVEREQLDAASLSFADLMMPRVPDGRRLYAALSAALRPAPPAKVGLPASLRIAGEDVAEVQAAAVAWLRWCEELFAEPGVVGPSWSAERLEYGFSVAAPMAQGERVLTAREYHGGQLDWHDFDLDPGATLHAAGDPAGAQLTRTVIPAPVSYRGMPAARFWAFEDARVDFGALDAGPEDLARMLLVEFAITFGTDWFVLPVELPVGSLCRSESLVVTNTFGERFVIPPSSAAGPQHATWRMFELSAMTQAGGAGAADQQPLFLLPPALLTSLESRPIEEVLFLRDEMANMAWGVERVVESATERPLSRYEQQRPEPQPAAHTGERLTYRLTTGAPDNWVPLLPVQSPAGLRLRRAKMLDVAGDLQTIAARGRILNPDRPASDPDHPASAGLALFEEEIPREGVRVTRSYQLARWHDGSTHLWIGRRKAVGRGEGSSGLAFDQLDPSP